MNIKDIYIYKKDMLDDILSCAICLDYYKHPRNLNCGHSFCTTCLQMIKINNEIVCPLCRNITKFNNKTLIDLSLNTTLVSFIDDHNKNNKFKCKRSKSLDILYNTKNKNKKKIYQSNIFKRENSTQCCSFQ